MEKFRLDKESMALRAAKELEDGMCVNLGFGIPSLAANYIPEGKQITFQAENGVVGYGAITTAEEADWDLVNAMGQPVTLAPGISFLDHAESFAMIRGGRVDVAVLGALQVSQAGDLASWALPGRVGGMGGAMDLVVGVKKVIVTMTHTTSDGRPKVVETCSLPLTGRACVDVLITDVAVLRLTPRGMEIAEVAPGWTPEEVQAASGADLLVADEVAEMSL